MSLSLSDGNALASSWKLATAETLSFEVSWLRWTPNLLFVEPASCKQIDRQLSKTPLSGSRIVEKSVQFEDWNQRDCTRNLDKAFHWFGDLSSLCSALIQQETLGLGFSTWSRFCSSIAVQAKLICYTNPAHHKDCSYSIIRTDFSDSDRSSHFFDSCFVVVYSF